ncbi:hypothetical protein [Streptomyces sp. NPDC005859]|uniref:hypothetical protein n=1 Tax=Streptomyces sp. NPDC005859 TaxID=3157170 RepID=UPI0033F81B25
MRSKQAIAIGATFIAVTAMAGCGSDDDSAGSGLPKASDIASVVSYVSTYTPCQDLKTGDDYDNTHEGEQDSEPYNESWGKDEAKDDSWGIKERAVCSDKAGNPITLLTVSDMKKFQAATKKNDEVFLVGQDFALVPESESSGEFLRQSTLMLLKCDPDFSVPSGYKKEPGLVDGCVLSNYFDG